MAFKVSNEVKVGALTAIAITLLILGFNFLKGNNPLKGSTHLYAVFEKIEGLAASNPVIMNGLTIGTVYKTTPTDEFLNSILVTIQLNEDIKIPTNSRAIIKGNLLSTAVIEISKGDANVYLSDGDTLQTDESSGFMATVLEQLGPTQKSLNIALTQMDTLLMGANNVLDVNAQTDLRQVIGNLSLITRELAQTSAMLNKMMRQQNNAITTTMANLEATSKQIKEGTENLPAISKNLETTTKNFSELELKATLASLNSTMAQVNTVLNKANSTDGSLGALMNDRKLYDNLASSVNSLNLLMQDLRLNPKRYVNISVFGKKDKGTPLMRPMDEDSITQEQFRKPQ